MQRVGGDQQDVTFFDRIALGIDEKNSRSFGHRDQLDLFVLVRDDLYGTACGAAPCYRQGNGGIALLEFVLEHFTLYVNTVIFLREIFIEKAE